MTWPMAVDLTAHYSSRQDFYLNLWILDWVARWVSEPGLELFRTEALYHPLGTSLASQDLTLVQTLAAAPLTLWKGPVVAFNALVLASFWLAGFATFLWVRRLTGDAAAGLLAGVLYSCAPYHLLYIPQLGMVAIGFVPLFLLADASFSSRPGAGRAARAGAALAVVGLGAWYYGVAAGLVALVTSAGRLLRAGPVARGRAAAREAVFWGCCALLLAPVVAQMLPAYLESPSLAGGEEREGMGLLMRSFKGTSATVALWSFLGWTTLAFAALGLRPLRRVRGPLAMAVAFFVLSMGEGLTVGGVRVTLPYAWLQHLPALGAVRYPDRFFLMTQLGMAAVAGFGLVTLRARWRRGAAAAFGLAMLPLVEFWPGPLPHVPAPPPGGIPAATAGDLGAVLHVPTLFTHLDGEQMALQTQHRRPVVGGYLMRRDPDRVRALQEQPGLAALLDPTAVPPADLAAGLRAAGVRFVCLDRAPWVAAAGAEPGSVLLPFSLSGRAFLRQRLFPEYVKHQQLPALAARWGPLLSARLGPPLTSTKRHVVFAVPDP